MPTKPKPRIAVTHCKRCGKKRVPPKGFKYASKANWDMDPYCSSRCAREDHGAVQ